jgi:hypothetical protein
MGPVSQGDPLIYAEKTALKIVKTEVLEVDAAAHVAKVNVVQIEAATAEKVGKYFDSGKLVHHDKRAAQVTAKDIKAKDVADDSKAASKAVHGKVAREVDDPTNHQRMDRLLRLNCLEESLSEDGSSHLPKVISMGPSSPF